MFVFVFIILGIGTVCFGEFPNSFSQIEKLDIEQRLQSFFERPLQPEAMDRQGVKWNPIRNEIVYLHPELKSQNRTEESVILQQAQLKSSNKYQRWYCKNVLKRLDPNFPCESLRLWSGVHRSDRVQDLTQSWLKEPQYSLDLLPVRGNSERPLWSDDFWAIKRGGISYRYSKSEWFEDYRSAIDSYQQPTEWMELLKLPFLEVSKAIRSWSPAEKYDLSVKDEDFSLTWEQKNEGEAYLNEEGDVEGWMGLCHGWAPASIMVPRPERTVEWTGPKGVKIAWYPNDIKALITLAWANGFWENNFIGRRCEQKKVTTYPNGRIKTGDCFDNNPATFHLALGNLIGIAKSSFVMDKAYDYQVWNQPLVGYEFTYFNPLNREERSQNWKEVAVKYGSKFKKQDRFQRPLTRGKFVEGTEALESNLRRGTQDGHIKKVVGVIASVIYLIETTPPEFGPEPAEDQIARETFIYDLEIADSEHGEIVTGGEWYQNNHPDFLFVPKKNAQVTSYWDRPDFAWDPTSIVIDENSLNIARTASSHGGYPLKEIVKALSESSTLPRSRNR